MAACLLVPQPDEPEDAASAGAAAFQQAALEAVRAARAMLDAAEAMIREPGALESVVDDLGAVAAKVISGLRAGLADSFGDPADSGPDSDDGRGNGFERITVE